MFATGSKFALKGPSASGSDKTAPSLHDSPTWRLGRRQHAPALLARSVQPLVVWFEAAVRKNRLESTGKLSALCAPVRSWPVTSTTSCFSARFTCAARCEGGMQLPLRWTHADPLPARCFRPAVSSGNAANRRLAGSSKIDAIRRHTARLLACGVRTHNIGSVRNLGRVRAHKHGV